MRHGRTELDRHLIGRTNVALSEDGWRATRRQIERLEWAMVVTSPLKRAQAAAFEASDRAGTKLRIDPDWAEMDFGAWDGLETEVIRRDHARAFRDFYNDPSAHPPPGGETWDALKTRIDRGLRAALADPGASPCLVMTHAGAIRAALAVACGLERSSLWCFRIAHSAVLTLDVRHDERGGLWGEIVALQQP